MERSILVERKVRAHPVVVGGVIRQQMAEVSFSQGPKARLSASSGQPNVGARRQRFIYVPYTGQTNDAGMLAWKPNCGRRLRWPLLSPR